MPGFSYPVLSDAFRPEGGSAEPISAVDRVLEHLTRDCPWDYRPTELLALQLEAFNERLRDRREQIVRLDQLASQMGQEVADTVDDVVPLLFHSDVYKDYPSSFVARGRWRQLFRWFESLATFRLSDVDFDGCIDIDDFNRRIKASGGFVMNTNSVRGKAYIYPESQLDRDRIGEVMVKTLDWMLNLAGTAQRPIFYTSNLSGSYAAHSHLGAMQRALGRPGATYGLFNGPMLTSEVCRLAALNSAASDGSASADELEELRVLNARTAERFQRGIEDFSAALLSHAQEPVLIGPLVYVIYRAMRHIKRAHASVPFNPRGAIWLAGSKNADLMPADYMSEIQGFYGLPIKQFYGQSELHGRYAQCCAGRMHLPPNVMLILLDPSTGQPRPRVGDEGEGRAACFDFSIDGRWGGLISSDVLGVRFRPCPCGLESPTLLRINGADATAPPDR